MTMFTLLIIAVLAMIIDHIPKALSLQLFLLDNFAIGLDKSYALIHIMDNIGRIAFPFLLLVSRRVAEKQGISKNT